MYNANLGLSPFHLAVAKAPDHIVIIDFKGIIIYANKAAVDATGYSLNEMIGKKFGSHELWGRLMSRGFYQNLWKTVRHNKSSFTAEVANKRKDGKRYTAALSIFPVLDRHENITSFVCIEKNITKEKQLKTDFLYLAAHQLTSPLTSISLALDLLLRDNYGPFRKQQRRALKEIQRDLHGLANLIRAFLNVSKIELGIFTIESESIDLRAVLEEILNQARPYIERKKLNLSTNYEPALPAVTANRDIVKMIIHNLLSNAIKYTPAEGNITLALKTKGKVVIMAVSDTGWGIPYDQQQKIFAKFFRGRNILEKDASGTGLGLYLAKVLLKALGGKIWFRSKENQGTTFYAAIPLSAQSTPK